MSTISELKKKSSKSFEKLKSNIDKEGKKDFSDDRIWTPTKDKNGNAFSIIRFLDAPQGEDDAFVKIFTHGFKGPGGWYIENSLTTLGKQDPVSELNSELWNSTTDDESPARAQARRQKRQLSYWANIYVVKDSGNPENDGKVFLYRFGPKILAKIKDKTHPDNDIEQPINVFDYWEGANFRLKVKNIKVGKDIYPSYDDSSFDSPSALSDDDKEIERIYKSCYSLQEIIDPSNFKSYDELKKRLDQVLKKPSISQDTPFSDELDDDDDEIEYKPTKKTRVKDELDDDEIPFQKTSSGDEDESDDDEEYFKNLVSRSKK